MVLICTLPAPESSHAIKVAIDEALKCKETGEEKTILFGLTGTGFFDMYAYEKFHNGVMENYVPSDEEIATGLARLPEMLRLQHNLHKRFRFHNNFRWDLGLA